MILLRIVQPIDNNTIGIAGSHSVAIETVKLARHHSLAG
jgi:hypothetical protein